MWSTSRCALLTVLGVVLVFGCDPDTQVCSDKARSISAQIRNDLYRLLSTTTKIDLLKEVFSEDADLIHYEDINGKKLLMDAAQNLKKILKSKTDAVDRIADFVREKNPLKVQKSPRDPPTCGYLLAYDSDMTKKINLTYYKEFNAKVNLSETVVHFPIDVYEFSGEIKSAIKITDGLDRIFVENYKRDQFIFAQYFGSTSGLLRYFPAYYWGGNNETDEYDCRFRPWYIEAAGQPRDVVFLMDTSGSMYGWALRVAKFTAKRLLSIVSDKDHIAFYTFNKTTDSISCNPLLERARLKYINYLSGKIDKIESYGPSNFSLALITAFDVLNSSARQNKTCDCQQAIIIFSDYVWQDYSELLQRLNPDGRVRIFILAFGAPNQGDTSKLEKIACTNNGYFSRVYSYGDVVPAISNILEVFGQPLSLNIPNIQTTWSTVYYEYDRKNFVMTVGKSVVLDYSLFESRATEVAPFLGVAAIDVDIPQMKNIMTGMFSGIMYAFMINNNGVIILHPRMGPIENYTEKPDMDINEMEITNSDSDIRNIAGSMLSRVTGNTTTKSLLYFKDTLRGKENYQDTTYYFTSLDGYPFSIGIVVPASERQELKVYQEKINKTLVTESILKDVPDRLRWKKYPLCTMNITDTIKPVVDGDALNKDPCYPDRYYSMAAEIQLTDPISRWWESAEFEQWKSTILKCEECILDAYLVTNAGITRTYRKMSPDSSVMDPAEMQPFIHSRKGIPPNTLLMSLLGNDKDKIHINISYSLGINYKQQILQPLAVGVKIQLKVLRYYLRTAFGENYDDTAITLLDENAFIIFSTDEGYTPTPILRFFDKKSPITEFVKDSRFFSKYKVKDCQRLCKEEIKPIDSSAHSLMTPLRSLSIFMNSIWKLFLIFLSNLLADKGGTEASHRRHKWVMCCEDEDTYFRDFNKVEPYEGVAKCGDCSKNITISPLPSSNILLVIDNNKDCVCQKISRPKKRYITELCQKPVSQWQSDLSQQICFDKLESNVSTKEGTWKCSEQYYTYSGYSPP